MRCRCYCRCRCGCVVVVVVVVVVLSYCCLVAADLPGRFVPGLVYYYCVVVVVVDGRDARGAAAAFVVGLVAPVAAVVDCQQSVQSRWELGPLCLDLSNEACAGAVLVCDEQESKVERRRDSHGKKTFC